MTDEFTQNQVANLPFIPSFVKRGIGVVIKSDRKPLDIV
jgi:hypothetical protein